MKFPRQHSSELWRGSGDTQFTRGDNAFSTTRYFGGAFGGWFRAERGPPCCILRASEAALRRRVRARGANRPLGVEVGRHVGRQRSYRWELTHKRGTGIPPYAGPPPTWQAWRASEAAVVQRDTFAFEESLLGPIVSFESAELLADSPASMGASALLQEAEP